MTREEEIKSILQDFISQKYTRATEWAIEHNQVIGNKRDYFITLAQLEAILGVGLEIRK